MRRVAHSLTMATKKTTKSASARDTLSIRLDVPTRARLAALAKLMGEKSGAGVDLPVSFALRAALERGMSAIEEDLGAKSKAKRSPA